MSKEDKETLVELLEEYAFEQNNPETTLKIMGQNAKFGIAVEEEVEPTIVAKGPGAVGQPVYHSSKNSFHTNFTDEAVSDTLVATDYKDPPTVSEEPDYIVRRLTPTECARLQGFPDDWCADVPHSDSAEYKLWGNGIALPCLLPMMKAMADILKEET